MTPRQKIEWLTNSWYGFALVSAIISLLSNGIGFFSIVFGGMGLAFSLFVTWVIGKLLLGRSSITRFVLVIFSGLGMVFYALAAAWSAWTFLGEWSLKYVFGTVLALVAASMNARSWKVLTDKGVKSYITNR